MLRLCVVNLCCALEPEYINKLQCLALVDSVVRQDHAAAKMCKVYRDVPPTHVSFCLPLK